jgi:serine/threonine protein kinase
MLLYGRYRVLRELGEGGMANVYLAEDAQLGRMVAIKVIRPELGATKELLQRFQNEARACAGIHHSNVISVHDFGVSGTDRYLVMEFMDGPNLSRLVKGLGRPLTDIEAAAVIIQAADGLSQAHQQGIIHRDVKPENLLLSSEGVLKVADFGIVHRDGAEGLTQTGAMIGSPNYMSPEQIDSEPVTEKTDLFALGGVLYFCFTGRSPFQGGSLTATLRNIGTSQPRPLAETRPDLDPFWSQCLEAMLQKRPEHRSLTMPSLADALRQFLQAKACPEPKQILKGLISQVDFQEGHTLSEASQAELEHKLSTRFGKRGMLPKVATPSDSTEDESGYEEFLKDAPDEKNADPVLKGWTWKQYALPYVMVPVIMAFSFFMSTPNAGYKLLKGITRAFQRESVQEEIETPSISEANDQPTTKGAQASGDPAEARIDSLIYSLRHGADIHAFDWITEMGKHITSHPGWTKKMALALKSAANESQAAKNLLPQSEYMYLIALFTEKRYRQAETFSRTYLKRFPEGPFTEAVGNISKSLEQMKQAGLY